MSDFAAHVLHVEDGYAPGRVSQAYGSSLTVLASLAPATPVAGDVMAEYTVNGEWLFTLTSLDGRTLYFDDPGELTPELERAIQAGERLRLDYPRRRIVDVIMLKRGKHLLER